MNINIINKYTYTWIIRIIMITRGIMLVASLPALPSLTPPVSSSRSANSFDGRGDEGTSSRVPLPHVGNTACYTYINIYKERKKIYTNIGRDPSVRPTCKDTLPIPPFTLSPSLIPFISSLFCPQTIVNAFSPRVTKARI